MSDTMEICFRKKFARKKERQYETKMTVDVNKKTVKCECLGETFTSNVVILKDFSCRESFESGNIYVGQNPRIESEHLLISTDWYWCSSRAIHLDRSGRINVQDCIDGRFYIYETKLVEPTGKIAVKRFIRALMKMEETNYGI